MKKLIEARTGAECLERVYQHQAKIRGKETQVDQERDERNCRKEKEEEELENSCRGEVQKRDCDRIASSRGK